jgi:hypothetical protein
VIACHCPYCGHAVQELPHGYEHHHCQTTKTYQSGCVRPLEQGGTWFLGIRDQIHLTADSVRGTGHVRILTGRWNENGSIEVLMGAYGKSDLDAMSRLDGYARHVMQDRA